MKIDQAKTRHSDLSHEPVHEKDNRRVSILNDIHRTEISYLNVDNLHHYAKQARRVFVQEDIDNLAKTILEHGIRQPLTVLRIDDDKPHFEIVSGERRFRAAKQVGLKKIPCIIIDDAKKAEEIALVENVQRSDLHPVELARSLKSLVDVRGWGGQKELSEKIGLSPSQISELLKITTLEDCVLEFALSQNLRGRELYRTLLSLPDVHAQMGYLHALSVIKPKEEGSTVSEKRTESVFRVSLSDNKLKIQKTKLRTLTPDQKNELVRVLESVLIELKNDYIL
jgi:ParB family chromosome partitioning protein